MSWKNKSTQSQTAYNVCCLYDTGKEHHSFSTVKLLSSLYMCIQVPGADPSKQSGVERIAVRFEAGALPKLQSFKSAVHSKGGYHLLVGGRYAATACTILYNDLQYIDS